MLVSSSKRLTHFQNCFGLLSRLCRAKNRKTFSHFKYLFRQHSTESRATCCPQATGWTGLVYTLREFPKLFLVSLLKSSSQRKIYQIIWVLEDTGNISIIYFTFSCTCISPPHSTLFRATFCPFQSYFTFISFSTFPRCSCLLCLPPSV
jgi:hypothetical protein